MAAPTDNGVVEDPEPRAAHFGVPKQSTPDRYIRRVGRKFQARPWDQGERFDLGTFDTIGQAHIAIREFWWGRRMNLPKFVRRSRVGNGFIVRVRYKGLTLDERYDTREQAAERVRAFLTEKLGAAVAAVVMRRR